MMKAPAEIREDIMPVSLALSLLISIFVGVALWALMLLIIL